MAARRLTAVIHLARPFSNSLRHQAARRAVKGGDRAPPLAELAARLDDVGAQVKIRYATGDEEMVARHTAKADNLSDLQSLGVAQEEVHLFGVHAVRDGPDFLKLRRLDSGADQEARLRRAATLRRLRSRGILVKRRVPPAELTPAGPVYNRSTAGAARGRDSASWILGRLQVISAKIARGVREYEK